jgi:Zn-dependent alcohol dehydrogenase
VFRKLVQRKIVMCSNLLCTACGVCHSDLHVINKDQPYPIPCVLGHEITGEVVEHGAHTDPATVHRLPVGSRVVGSFIMPCGGCFFCVKGQEDLCETFFKYNRGMGGLYDGTTRLYLSRSGLHSSLISQCTSCSMTSSSSFCH